MIGKAVIEMFVYDTFLTKYDTLYRIFKKYDTGKLDLSKNISIQNLNRTRKLGSL